MVVEAMAVRTETVENFMVLLVFVWRGDEREEWDRIEAVDGGGWKRDKVEVM